MSVTPAQIRAERKKVLRDVKASLKMTDSKLEVLERTINRVLKVKKRLPDADDAVMFLSMARDVDTALDKTIASINNFSQFVRTT